MECPYVVFESILKVHRDIGLYFYNHKAIIE